MNDVCIFNRDINGDAGIADHTCPVCDPSKGMDKKTIKFLEAELRGGALSLNEPALHSVIEDAMHRAADYLSELYEDNVRLRDALDKVYETAGDVLGEPPKHEGNQ